MSAEVEKTEQEDDEIKEVKKSLRQHAKEKWQVGLKLLELILSVICLSLICDPAKTAGLGKKFLHHVGIMYTAYTGYMLIICVILLGRYIGDRLPYKTSAIFSFCGSILFLVTGVLLITDKAELAKNNFFHPNAYLLVMMTASGLFALLNSLVFAVDAIVTFRRKEEL